MNSYKFKELKLNYGEIMYIVNENGEGITGIFEDEYDSSKETFRFQNHSNGQNEILKIDKLQEIRRY